jgi:hypothetical protein
MEAAPGRGEHRGMYAATTFDIHPARPEDTPALERLGWADDWPGGDILVGEIGGVIAAALAIDEQRTVFAATPGVPFLLGHLRARAAGIQAQRRTPSAAERIRERLTRRDRALV